jgi:site-specific recombinase XerD
MKKPVSSNLQCLKPNHWPLHHQEAWNTSSRKGGLFSNHGPATKWREATIEKNKKGYGIWLSWIHAYSGLSQDVINESNPEDLITKTNVSNYILHLLDSKASLTVYNRIQELYDCIRVMTPKLSKSHWEWLKNAWTNLRNDAYPVRNKLLRLKEADQLEALGFKLMQQAETAQTKADHQKSGLTEIQRALIYRDGLMIALLIRRPFRIENFYSLSIGANVLIGDLGSSFIFRADEMKGKRSMSVPFPKNLVDPLKRYLDHYRPILLAAKSKCKESINNALWISRYGTALTQSPVRVAIYNRTEAEFGVRIPPHWFRDSAVTTMIRDTPESAKITGLILGHTTPDIAQKHYNQAQMIHASRRHFETIKELIIASYEEASSDRSTSCAL